MPDNGIMGQNELIRKVAAMVVARTSLINRLKKSLISVSALSIMLSWAAPAHAIQTHDGMEGLVAHQIGHILFTLGMATLLVSIFHRGLKGPGWAQFKAFLVLAIGWNILTFAGHWLREYMAPQYVMDGTGRTCGFQITDLGDGLFYLSKLDHILLIPALLFLLLALRKWRQGP